MSFSQWIFSTYPNPAKDGAWGALHITVLLLCIAFIIASTLLLKNRSEKTKYRVLLVLAIVMIIFGVARRINGFILTTDFTLNRILKVMLPRPGCAISCWLVAIALAVRKKYFYNFASSVAILCAVIFFAYPGAGFTNEYILFENLYSIVTHSIFFVIAICFITYGFTDFKTVGIRNECICLATMLAYVFIEIYLMKIDPDPFFFLPKNEVQDILGIGYGLYLPLYLVFIVIYFSSYRIIPKIKEKCGRK